MAGLPLEGVRILDLTHFMAGPIATQLLGFLGAEVIKIESIQRMDLFRLNQVVMQDQVWEKAPFWLGSNLNKDGVTLDLGHPDGRALFLELARTADVVIENYSARVMRNFGLDYPVLREANPTIVMVSIPGYGKAGPWRHYVGFAFTFEQLSGISGLTGYPDGAPLNVLGAADPLGAMHVAYATLLALQQRQRTGRGQYVEVVQLELLIGLLGREVMEWTINRRLEPRRGNRHHAMAPHGVYPCKGSDEWVAIAVASDAEFQRLCEVMGPSAIEARDPKFRSAVARLRHQDELDAGVARWTRARSKGEVMELLQSAGVAAGAVLTSADVLRDPHLRARRFFQEMERELVGRAEYPAWAFRSEAMPRRHRAPAPLLGQHNRRVLGELLALPGEVLGELQASRVIGTAPLERQESTARR